MTIAVDQTRLRRIVETILAGEHLNRREVTVVLHITQLAAGMDDVEDPAEHSVLQAIAQHVTSLVGLESDEICAIAPLGDPDARISWFRSLAAELHTRCARELAFALAFLVSIADLELAPAEHETLEELQFALGVGHRRATDLVILLTQTVAAPEQPTHP